jgi:hypothetical protein
MLKPGGLLTLISLPKGLIEETLILVSNTCTYCQSSALLTHRHTDFSPSDFDDKITATSKATPSQLGNTFTPAGIARTQTYKILQDMVLESFDTSKTQIERHRQDTTSEITSHLHRVLDEHAERFCKEKSLAKCQAVSALRQDFDNGVEIKPEEVVARYTSQVSWSPFDVREVLADVGNAYPDVSNAYSDVSFLDADTTDS